MLVADLTLAAMKAVDFGFIDVNLDVLLVFYLSKSCLCFSIKF